MKGMVWVWLGALLMGMIIMGITEYAGDHRQPVPVFATQEATVSTG